MEFPWHICQNVCADLLNGLIRHALTIASAAGAQEQHELKYLELFCNPNASANAFTAKVLVSLQTYDGVKLATEGALTSIKADIDLFMESVGAAV